MTELLALPSSLRIVMFTFSALALATLVFCITYGFIGKWHKLFNFYLLALFAGIFIMLITHTPLDRSINDDVATYLHLVLLVPAILAIVVAVKDNKWVLIADAVWCVFNLPFFDFIPYYAYISSASFAYIFVRIILLVFYVLHDVKLYPGRLAIKYALDSAENGIAFVNVFSRITYINTKLRYVLAEIGISSYQNVNKILSKIKEQSEISGRKISDLSYIVNVDGFSFRFAFDHPLTQISCVDVSEEEKLVKETELNKTLISKANDDLSTALSKVDEIQSQKELFALKGRIHDDLAQRLSILHMFILNDDSNDLKHIKEMLSTLDISTQIEQNVDTVEGLVSMLASIGVQLDVQGELPQDENLRALFYKLLKEASTNAIKHGKSHEISAVFRNTDELVEATVSNSGTTYDDKITFGNGLNGLRSEAESLGGTLTVSPFPIFTVTVAINKKQSA